jgi:hypothetical protein
MVVCTCATSALVYGFWQNEFGLTSFVFVLLMAAILLLIVVGLAAAAFADLILGKWRKAVSTLAAIILGGLVIWGGITMPIDLRFAIAARSQYEDQLSRAGYPKRKTWVVEAQFLGPDETDLIYDETKSETDLQSEFKAEFSCSLDMKHVYGHFYLRSDICDQ